MPIPWWLSPSFPCHKQWRSMIYLHKEKHSELVPWLLIFFFHDSNYGSGSGIRHTLCLRTSPRQRHMAHPDALKGQAVPSGLGSLTASLSHPSSLRKGRGISQALPGLAGICAMSRSLGFRPAHLERLMLMLRVKHKQTKSSSTSNLRKIWFHNN